jgi:hypothetical protein
MQIVGVDLHARQQTIFQREASAAETSYGGQVVLGTDVSTLVRMEACAGSRAAGDGRSLASHRIQAVLEIAVAASQLCGQKVCEQ